MASSDKTRSGVDEESSSPKVILKVFQAGPLAYEDWTGRENPIPCVDFETECTILQKALEGTPVHPIFETATTTNLGLFLSQGNHPFYTFPVMGTQSTFCSKMSTEEDTCYKWTKTSEHGSKRVAKTIYNLSFVRLVIHVRQEKPLWKRVFHMSFVVN
jgi:hypothetical protein